MQRPPADSGPLLVALVRGPRDADAAHTRAFAEELEQAITAGCERVLIDLSETDNLTTPALNALLGARQELLAREGRIVIVLSAGLRRIFVLLGLDSRFTLASDRDRAGDLLGLAIARAA